VGWGTHSVKPQKKVLESRAKTKLVAGGGWKKIHRRKKTDDKNSGISGKGVWAELGGIEKEQCADTR